MENFYFPLFLVVAAIVVVLVFKKAGSRDRSPQSGSRIARTPAGRSADADRLARNLDRRGPAAPRSPGPAKSKDIWQTRRERAAKDSFAETAARRATHHAGFLGPSADADRGSHGGYELREQNISASEHLGIDEYLTKREREEAERAAREAGGLSMTAVKYEPGDADSADDKDRKKQASFKP